MQAQMDQFESEIKPVAGMLKAYFDALAAVGFSEDDAFTLTTEFSRYVFDRQLKQGPGRL
jgi:hypothetical protein